MAITTTFHWVDYMIFVLMLVISAAIGIFYAWKDKKKQTTANFLLGGRKMALLPVTLSLMATFLSAILVLGVPTEVFYNGTMYWLISFSNIITFPVAAHAFLPVFHELGLTSAYEVRYISNTLRKCPSDMCAQWTVRSAHWTAKSPRFPLADSEDWPRGYKTFFILNSAEHEICPANEIQITNICKFFLAKHSWAWKCLC